MNRQPAASTDPAEVPTGALITTSCSGCHERVVLDLQHMEAIVGAAPEVTDLTGDHNLFEWTCPDSDCWSEETYAYCDRRRVGALLVGDAVRVDGPGSEPRVITRIERTFTEGPVDDPDQPERVPASYLTLEGYEWALFYLDSKRLVVRPR